MPPFESSNDGTVIGGIRIVLLALVLLIISWLFDYKAGVRFKERSYNQ
jgi:uncharacterized membrane protein YadS